MATEKNCIQATAAGVGTGGPGGTHIYDFTKSLSREQVERLVLIDSLRELAALGDSIRDQHPTAYKAVSAALTAGASMLPAMFGAEVSGQGRGR
jgi:hypothetical protein